MLRRSHVVTLASLLLLAACSRKIAEPDTPTRATATSALPSSSSPNGSMGAKGSKGGGAGLLKEDVVVGTGAEAKSGSKVTVHYTGTLTDGTKFDSSRDKGVPFPFTIDSGDVIPGWDQGVTGMKVGGKRKLTIPPELAYGDAGQPPVIPPKATLLFDIELLDVK